jgi:hypothetical protein
LCTKRRPFSSRFLLIVAVVEDGVAFLLFTVIAMHLREDLAADSPVILAVVKANVVISIVFMICSLLFVLSIALELWDGLRRRQEEALPREVMVEPTAPSRTAAVELSSRPPRSRRYDDDYDIYDYDDHDPMAVWGMGERDVVRDVRKKRPRRKRDARRAHEDDRRYKSHHRGRCSPPTNASSSRSGHRRSRSRSFDAAPRSPPRSPPPVATHPPPPPLPSAEARAAYQRELEMSWFPSHSHRWKGL